MKTLKQVAMAEKLSVPQLQQAVKDGSIESWIGIPMLQERMKEQKQAQAMAAAQQPKQPPIAEQVMAEASGVGGLPSNLPQEYAQGGILGYAEGGETDDDLDDAREEEEFQQYAAAMLNRTPNVEQGLRSAPSMSYGQVQGVAPRAARQSAPAESKYDASGHKYDEIASKRAEERGMPAGLARFMLHKETGGIKNPDAATSKAGAYGPAQIMPATAKSRGINYKDPVENVLGGVDYLAELYHKYDKNPELALAAYNAGPGRVDRALKSGQGIAGLPTETKGYVKFASGGSIKGYSAGDVINVGGLEAIETDDPDYVIADGVKTKRSLLEQSAASPWNTVGKPTSKPAATQESGTSFLDELGTGAKKALAATADVVRYPAAKGIKGINTLLGTSIPVTESDTPFYDKYIRGAEETAAPVAPQKPAAQTQAPATTKEPESALPKSLTEQVAAPVPKKEVAQPSTPDGYEELMKMIRENMAKREANKAEDKWMGLLSAGLGMMGGTSPYGAVNVGQGAMYGLQQYGQARKQSAAEEAADLKNLITAQRYQSLDKYYKEMGGQRAEDKTRQLNLQEEAQSQKALTDYERLWDNRLNQAIKAELNPMNQEKIRKQFTDRMYSDPTWQKLWKRANPGTDLPDMGTPSVEVPKGVTVTRVK